jgi:hypothetical protein
MNMRKLPKITSVMLGSLSCSFTSISLLSNLICLLSVMLGSLSCSFTSISILSNLICLLSVMLGSLQIRLESKDIDVNEHEKTT